MIPDQNSGTVITKQEAKTYIDAFKVRYPNEVTAFFVGASKVDLILRQPNCIGIRIYNGYNTAESKMNQVLVGVNAQQQDMSEGVIIERLITCPPYCPSSGALNQ
ncbi:hypothetical protein [Flavobacterium sp.]|uniref:hypothetical protein n=1 Tax=Flavobacterium sp. TaxID=239 RepID=UPI001207D995|nr:hypothetical protein [Flavobacterium sp.]RZJ71717.1 MAG: hypothetical protein EOO49_08615 [Flavobacterium sp.]